MSVSHCIAGMDLSAFMCWFTLAAEVLSPRRTQPRGGGTHGHLICSAFRQSLFFCLWQLGHCEILFTFFLPPRMFCATLPRVKTHIVSFNQFNQFDANESEEASRSYLTKLCILDFQSKLLLFLFKEHRLLSSHLLRYPFLQGFSGMHSELGCIFAKLCL